MSTVGKHPTESNVSIPDYQMYQWQDANFLLAMQQSQFSHSQRIAIHFSVLSEKEDLDLRIDIGRSELS